MTTAIQLVPDTVLGFANSGQFEHMQRVAKALSQSELVPQQFQGSIPNCIIALEMSQRMSASAFAIMQQMYIVHGKPSWSSQFVIACINSSGAYSPLRFKLDGTGDNQTCVAWAVELATQERLEGPPVSIAMAKKEGWYGKNGSKWQTMPELMLRYRAATFFGRLYAPEMLMGMQTSEEVSDLDIRQAAAKDVTPKRRTITAPEFPTTGQPENPGKEGGETETSKSANSPSGERVPDHGGNSSVPNENGSPQGAGEPPTAVAENDHDQLRIALADLNVEQSHFVEGLRRIMPGVVAKQAKLVADLSDAVVLNVLNEGLDDVLTQVENVMKKGGAR